MDFRLAAVQVNHTLIEENVEVKELKAIIDAFTTNLPDKWKNFAQSCHQRYRYRHSAGVTGYSIYQLLPGR
ncbi:hypothetical protein [Mucilaginibacter sp. UYCu711]|uniref:hypothetical protein n=1 Tax=Mucilaginibacter sp. UYCu711 TaxID=3156339 RepID=UPI003D1D947A